MTAEGVETRVPPGPHMQICAFLWVYYGYPASEYEGINVEARAQQLRRRARPPRRRGQSTT